VNGWAQGSLSSLLVDASPGFASGEDLDEGIFQVRMNNVTSEGALDLKKRRRVTLKGKRNGDLLLKPGDVLFNSTNSPELVGKSALFPRIGEPATFSNHFVRLRPIEGRLDGSFLSRWLHLQFQRGIFRGLCKQWVNQATVSRESLLALELPLPALPEQRRIAAILDQADALRAKRREALVQLDGLTQSIFIEMFGDPAKNPKAWPVTVLSRLVRDNDSINYGVVQPGDALDEGIPLVRVGDLVDGEFSGATLKRIDPSIESAYKRSRLRGDEILVSCVGSIGVTVLATPAMKGFNIARAVARIPLAEAVNRTFIASYLKTESVQTYFKSELRTVAQPTLNIKQLAEVKVFAPPLALQENFGTRIQAVESLKATQRAALAESDALLASLQHRAFSGQLS
jgi:type I restriction enzyme, S subunit